MFAPDAPLPFLNLVCVSLTRSPVPSLKDMNKAICTDREPWPFHPSQSGFSGSLGRS